MGHPPPPPPPPPPTQQKEASNKNENSDKKKKKKKKKNGSPRRPWWFVQGRTAQLAECLPDEPNTDRPTGDDEQVTPTGWLRFRMTRPLPPDLVGPPMHFRIVEPPPADTKAKSSTVERMKKARKRARGTTSLCTKVDEAKTDRRVFALRLKPTTDQKLLFQRAFSIARLAKKLAYKALGDQRQPITTQRILAIKKTICSERLQIREPIKDNDDYYCDDDDDNNNHDDEDDDKKKKRMRVVGHETNTYLAPSTRRVLYEQHHLSEEQGQRRRLPNHVRCTAVIKFCQAVKSVQGQIAERQAEWDWAAQAHERYLMGREDTLLLSLSSQQGTKEDDNDDNDNKKKKKKRQQPSIASTNNNNNNNNKKKGGCKGEDKREKVDRYGVSRIRKRPPDHPDTRPEMMPWQVKWPDRNRLRHSFSVDANPKHKANPFTVRWDDSDCWNEGAVLFMKEKLRLWGCPSKRRRQLERLTQRMRFCPPSPEDSYRRKPEAMAAGEAHRQQRRLRRERASREQATLKYDNGRYYLMVQCLSDKMEPRCDRDHPRFVAMDPGIRTFLSTYDDQGRFGDVGGRRQIRRVLAEARKADLVRSRLAKQQQQDGNGNNDKWWSKRRRKKARKLVRRHNQKCRDLKADGHWKVARALCQRYDHILLPKFNSRAAARVLGSKVTRQMGLWSHYQFRQRLHHKAQQLGARVHLCSEHSSTITCGRCLWVEETMRKNPTPWFHCRKCDYGIDRDSNAARNIAIMNAEKYMGRLEATESWPLAMAVAEDN